LNFILGAGNNLKLGWDKPILLNPKKNTKKNDKLALAHLLINTWRMNDLIGLI
jgi:hypothetical protein